MIPFELALWLISQPCMSDVRQQPGSTVVTMCPAPTPKSQPVPPWWRAGITHEPQSVKIEPKKAAPKKATKKKSKKRRR